LTNADKYSPAGRLVEVEATVAPPIARNGVSPNGSADNGHHAENGARAALVPTEVGISVLDRGPGLAESDRGKILEPLYPARPSENRDVQGFGIGLSACRRLVEVMGGRIWMEPREGGGSAFRFTLPVEVAEYAEPLESVRA